MSIHKDDRIVYPSYSDVELKGGKVVSPNKKFEVSSTSAAKREVSARGAHVTQWSLQDFSRTCGGGVCHYSYGIYDGSGNAATPCGYNVMGTPATHASYDSVKCGKFIVTSAWDSEFCLLPRTTILLLLTHRL